MVGGVKGKEPTTKNVLVAWTPCVNWNSLRSQVRDNVEMMQSGETKFFCDLPLISVIFEHDME